MRLISNRAPGRAVARDRRDGATRQALALLGLDPGPSPAVAAEDIEPLIRRLVDEDLDLLLERICTRDLALVPCTILRLDAQPVEGERDATVCAVMATAFSEDGGIQPVGCSVIAVDDSRAWARFLLSMSVRGLRGIEGIEATCDGVARHAAAEVFPGAAWCVLERRDLLGSGPAGSSAGSTA